MVSPRFVKPKLTLDVHKERGTGSGKIDQPSFLHG